MMHFATGYGEHAYARAQFALGAPLALTKRDRGLSLEALCGLD